jgi:hypothetical protein
MLCERQKDYQNTDRNMQCKRVREETRRCRPEEESRAGNQAGSCNSSEPKNRLRFSFY